MPQVPQRSGSHHCRHCTTNAVHLCCQHSQEQDWMSPLVTLQDCAAFASTLHCYHSYVIAVFCKDPSAKGAM
eukprot:3798308-Amphidinium_carterae.1